MGPAWPERICYIFRPAGLYAVGSESGVMYVIGKCGSQAVVSCSNVAQVKSGTMNIASTPDNSHRREIHPLEAQRGAGSPAVTYRTLIALIAALELTINTNSRKKQMISHFTYVFPGD